jgi:5-methylcytosine-specific restriction endonuclease McrA
MKYPRIEGESEEEFKKRRHNEICAEYRRLNKLKVLESRRKWASKNSEYDPTRYAKNKENIKERIRTYKKANSGKVVYWNKNRSEKIRKATPNWAKLDKIRQIYETASGLQKSTGLEFHVDHIVPLKGKNVCGFHVEYNLRILSKEENLRKGNRLLPETPCALGVMKFSM